jgi:hypothetical protein
MSLNILGTLAAGLFVASLFAIAFILAQLRRKPRVYTPYLFLIAIAITVTVDLTGIIHWETATKIEWLPLVLLSGLTFVEYTSRNVHPSHFWTALSTCVITIAWCVMAVFAWEAASV